MAIPRLSIPLSYNDILAVLGERTAVPVPSFEDAFARRYGVARAVAFCRCRMAFYHLLRALDLPAGSEVLMGALHVADFVNIIRLAGFTPVIVDLEPDGFRLDQADLEHKMSPRAAVLLATHLSGYMDDMPRLAALCQARNVVLVEDCSQAFAAGLDGRRAGQFGHAAIFSMSLLKSVCTLNGGMVISQDAGLMARLRAAADAMAPAGRGALAAEAMKNFIVKTATAPLPFSLVTMPLLRATTKGGDWFSRYQKTNKTVELRDALPPAFLERFSPAQAGLGLRTLARLDAGEDKRRGNGRLLYSLIAGDHRVRLPPATTGADNGFWLFPLIVEEPERLKRFLARRGIDASRMLLSAVSREDSFRHLDFTAPQAERTRDHTLFIPCYPSLDEADIRAIAAAVAEFQQEHGPC